MKILAFLVVDGENDGYINPFSPVKKYSVVYPAAIQYRVPLLSPLNPARHIMKISRTHKGTLPRPQTLNRN